MQNIKRTTVKALLADPDKYIGSEVDVKGWVRTRRGNKNVAFIALNDGSSIKNVQIVVDFSKIPEESLKDVTTGASIHVQGQAVASQGKGQVIEIQADEIELYGTASVAEYPLQKKGHSLEFLREIFATLSLMLFINSSTTRVSIISILPSSQLLTVKAQEHNSR